MNAKTTGDPGQHVPESPTNQNLSGFAGKGTNKSLMYKILYLLFCQKATAAELNAMTGSNDSRKYISRLRQEGFKILDYRRDDQRKVYFSTKAMQNESFNVDDCNFKSFNSISYE